MSLVARDISKRAARTFLKTKEKVQKNEVVVFFGMKSHPRTGAHLM